MAGGTAAAPRTERGTSKAATEARVAAEVESWRALRALSRDPSAKARVEAAGVLVHSAAPDAPAALRRALARDRAPAVRRAAVAALLARGGAAELEALRRAQARDRDPSVRAVAAAAVIALERSARTFALGPVEGGELEASLRERLRQGLLSELVGLGFVAQEGQEEVAFRLRPSVTAATDDLDGGGSRIEVHARVVALDPAGRTAAMVEGGARASAPAALADPSPLWEQAIDAAAHDLAEALAPRMREHAPTDGAAP